MSENLYVELSDRSKQIFKSVVETYLETGFPSGSETILKKGGVNLSSSSIRLILANLQKEGLLISNEWKKKINLLHPFRIIDDEGSYSDNILREISNYLNTKYLNKSIGEIKGEPASEIRAIDELYWYFSIRFINKFSL